MSWIILWQEYLDGQNAESLYCLQPLCKMGVSAASAVWRSERIILPPDIMHELSSCQTADMRSAIL